MERLREFEAFAGYGSQAMALERLGLDYEVVEISEIDKHAIDAYMAVHGKTRNYGDISKIDWAEVDGFDLLTYSFPCTDISVAGRQEGLDGVSRTLKAECHDAGVVDGWRIRKLTPRECFRLMGVSETDIDKIQASGISKTQQYKMAGNSIVVDVLYHIFRKLFVDKGCEEKQLELF